MSVNWRSLYGSIDLTITSLHTYFIDTETGNTNSSNETKDELANKMNDAEPEMSACVLYVCTAASWRLCDLCLNENDKIKYYIFIITYCVW